jgi:hypothetical protein
LSMVATCDRGLRQAGIAPPTEDVAGSRGQLEVGGDCDHDHGADRALVEVVRLENDDRAPKSRCRSDWPAQCRPPDLASAHYHFSRSARAWSSVSTGSVPEDLRA